MCISLAYFRDRCATCLIVILKAVTLTPTSERFAGPHSVLVKGVLVEIADSPDWPTPCIENPGSLNGAWFPIVHGVSL